MEIIEELEKNRRGIYAEGIFVILDFAGNLDSCIALRTMVIKKWRSAYSGGRWGLSPTRLLSANTTSR